MTVLFSAPLVGLSLDGPDPRLDLCNEAFRRQMCADGLFNPQYYQGRFKISFIFQNLRSSTVSGVGFDSAVARLFFLTSLYFVILSSLLIHGVTKVGFRFEEKPHFQGKPGLLLLYMFGYMVSIALLYAMWIVVLTSGYSPSDLPHNMLLSAAINAYILHVVGSLR